MNPPPIPLPTPGMPYLLSMALPLLFILGALATAAFIARRLAAGLGARAHGHNGSINVIAVRNIGWHASLFVVQAQGSQFLISSSRSGIKTIGRLPVPPASAAISAPISAP